MPIALLSLAAALVSAVAVLLCPVLDQPLLALVPLAVILAYTLFALWEGGGDSESLSWYGDHVYFLAYVSTITAFAGIVVKAWIDGEGLSHPEPVLFMAGVALLTTVAGLVAMTFLRAAARSAERTLPAEPRSAPAAAGAPAAEDGAVLPVAVASAVRSRELVFAADQATEVLTRLASELERLNQGIVRLHGTVAGSNPEVEGLARNVAEMESVLQSFVSTLESRLEGDAERAGGDGR